VSVEPLTPRAQVKLALSPNQILNLPLWLAIDRGDFDKAGLDVELFQFRGGGARELPRLARGDYDVMTAVTPAPALFNQLADGFDIKVIASHGIERPDRMTAAWLTIVKGKENEIRTFDDLRGKTVEGAAPGTPLDLLAREALRQAGLTPDRDVNLTFRVRETVDMVALARAKAADVIAMNEPQATRSEEEGLVVRWKGVAEVAPWYQPSLLALSSQFLSSNPAAAAQFLEVYLAASRGVNTTNGQWTDDLIETATRWAEVEASVITSQGNVPYYEPNGQLAVESLERAQNLWVELGEVRTRSDVQRLVDLGPLGDALGRVGRVN
jgi:ABC-type nitrate/sulfonate/bicarbonate transport system substrate-binding protein